MDRSQEQLLKRLELLKQKIQEQYPELSEKMSDAHLKKIRDKNNQDKGKEKHLVKVNKSVPGK